MEKTGCLTEVLESGIVKYQDLDVGVTRYHNRENKCDIDLDVEPGVKMVEIFANLEMPDSDKCFPDVERLVIADGVYSIEIKNELFPNVKKVESHSNYFISHECLIKKVCNPSSMILLNTFCKDENDFITINQVDRIAKNAFHGCRCTNVRGTHNIKCWKNVEEGAFDGSALIKQPFVNGLKLVDTIVIDIDYNQDEIILPDSDGRSLKFIESIKLTKVKKMVIHRLDSLKWINYHTGFPQNLVLDVDCFVDPADLIDMAKLKTYDYYVHTFEVRSPDYVTIDGVVYTQNRKKAVTCDADMENLVILDGVEEIIPFAFSGGQKLKTVRLPDSLEKIGMNAFELCRQLHRIDLGEGVTIIPDSCFERCTELKTITLPPQIKEIRREAFWLSGLEVINLNEGLERVHDNAFVGTCIESIKIPKTVQDFPKNAISHSMKNITMGSYLPNVKIGIIESYRPGSNTDTIAILHCGDKHAILPLYTNSTTYSKYLLAIDEFFKNESIKHTEFWQYASTAKGKEDGALEEYLFSGGGDAKDYIKKNSKKIALRLIAEGEEEKLVKLLETGVVSKPTLKVILPKVKEQDMTAAQSYVLEQLNKKGISENKFAI